MRFFNVSLGEYMGLNTELEEENAAYEESNAKLDETIRSLEETVGRLSIERVILNNTGKSILKRFRCPECDPSQLEFHS